MGRSNNRLPFSIAMNTRISITPRHISKPVKRYYICDRTRCENCSHECRHTTDLKYALYPDHDEWDLHYLKDKTLELWQKVKKYG